MEKIIYRKTLDVHKNGIQFTLQGFETADNMSRRIEINLMASGDTYELPLERVLALMYITTPKANEPSIEECIIKDNTIVYDVLPIVEEGITEMQLKLIDTSVDGAKSVLVSPRFAVEVLLSNADDGSAEQITSFTALENATAKATAVYNERLTKIEVDDKCIFKAHYADGTIYETDTIQKMLLQVTTDMDMTNLVKDGLTNFTKDELADELDERYNYAFAKAIYSDNLAKTYDVPTFVKWDKNTANTPYNSDPQLTEISDGFAICYGDTFNRIVVALVMGDKGNDCFTYKVSDGDIIGWDRYISASGGTMTGALNLGNGVGSVSADERGTYLEAKKDNDNSAIVLVTKDGFEEAAKLVFKKDGEVSEYNLFGTHNIPRAAQVMHGSYMGTGTKGSQNAISLSFPFRPSVLIFNGTVSPVVFHYGDTRAPFDLIGFGRSISVHWKDDEDNGIYTVSWYSDDTDNGVYIMMNTTGTHCYTAIG